MSAGDPVEAHATTPTTTPSPEVPPPEEEGLLATVVGVVVAPSTTLARVTASARLSWALVVAVAVTVLTSLAGAADAQPVGGPVEGSAPLAVVGAVVTPLAQLGLLAVSAALVWGVGRLLGGRGDYRATFCGLAFALVPWALTVPLPLLATVAGVPGRIVQAALSGVIAVWVAVLLVVAVGAAHRLSTGRAVAATVAPLVAFVAVAGAVVALIGAVAAMIGVAAFA